MKCLKMLFWNLCKHDLCGSLAAAVKEHCLDLVMVAEPNLDDTSLLPALSTAAGRVFHRLRSNCQGIRLYSQLSPTFFAPQHETSRLTIQSLTLPGSQEVLLAATHSISKLWYSDHSRIAEAEVLADDIRRVEEKRGHQRTLLAGDFNANPYELGVTAAKALNAVMTRRLAESTSRTIQAKKYHYFYNPMWGFFGDTTAGPAGTYYRDGGDHADVFWHIFDQVLLRPALLPYFSFDKLSILERIAGNTLLDCHGRPDAHNYSDHLPVTWTLSLPEAGSTGATPNG